MTAPPSSTERFADDILPAVHRSRDNILTVPGFTATYFAEELDLRRLHSIHHWLWAAGRPMPPRPLHHQLLLERQIFVTERLDLHLLWLPGKMFLKPLPRYLLAQDFWTMLEQSREKRSRRDGVALVARGFLSSYVALINHESDFAIARSLHLLPADVTWPQWKGLCQKQLSLTVSDPSSSSRSSSVDRRFHYGELRLSRINTIYRLTQSGHLLRGYMSRWNDYASFLRDQFALVAAVTLYTVVVLTAMQVGLATNVLAQNHVFQAVSYGFTVFSIVAPVVLCAGILLVFLLAFVVNWKVALAWRRSVAGGQGGGTAA